MLQLVDRGPIIMVISARPSLLLQIKTRARCKTFPRIIRSILIRMATSGGGSMWLPLLGLLLAPSEAEWTARLHNDGTAAAAGTARAARVAQPGPPLPALRPVFLWGCWWRLLLQATRHWWMR
jgi:hypothetical protein